MSRFCAIVAFLLITCAVNGQSGKINKKRLTGVITSETVAYGSSIFLLNNLWYRYYPRTGFHSFNDNAEWLQMDKAGHLMTSYYLGDAGYKALKWAGVEKNKSLWFGGTLGSFYLLSMEVLDGFSSSWGFSWGDVFANTAGSALFMLQEHAWDEQRIRLKFSAHLSPYATYRPDLLGYNTMERLIKDYNGQTYWLSININSFLVEDNKFPEWLNLAVGYSGSEMVSGRPEDNILYPGDFKPYRQFFIAPDIDFTRIPTSKPWLRTVFFALNMIKFPAPTLEFSQKGTKVYFFYF